MISIFFGTKNLNQFRLIVFTFTTSQPVHRKCCYVSLVPVLRLSTRPYFQFHKCKNLKSHAWKPLRHITSCFLKTVVVTPRRSSQPIVLKKRVHIHLNNKSLRIVCVLHQQTLCVSVFWLSSLPSVGSNS